MKKIVVIYAGKYGTTERYARWICEETGADLFAEKDVDAKALAAYDVIVFGGAVHAGGLLGIKTLKKLKSKLAGQQFLAFAVGLSVEEESVRKDFLEINFVKKLADIPCYFFRGAYDPEKVTGMDKKMMGVVRRMIAGKAANDMTESEREVLDAIVHGADYTDKSAIGPLVEAIKEITT